MLILLKIKVSIENKKSTYYFMIFFNKIFRWSTFELIYWTATYQDVKTKHSEWDFQFLLNSILLAHTAVMIDHNLQLHFILHSKGLKKYFLWCKIILYQTFLSSFCNSFFFLSSRKAARAALKTALVRWVSVRPQDLRREISWSRPVPVMTGSPVLRLNETFSSANWTIGW